MGKMFNSEDPTTKQMLNYIKTHWPEMVENPLELETEEGLIKLSQKANLLLEESGKKKKRKGKKKKKRLREKPQSIENFFLFLLFFFLLPSFFFFFFPRFFQ